MYRWQLHYKVEAVDLLSGITAEVDDHMNCSTAIDDAVDKVMEEVAKGYKFYIMKPSEFMYCIEGACRGV